MPVLLKTVPKVAADSLSLLTRSRVTTSLGLASIHVFMEERKVASVPASKRSQDVWQSSRTPFRLWTCACSIRTPAERATVAL